jgi:predicted dienelactone hydrolase
MSRCISILVGAVLGLVPILSAAPPGEGNKGTAGNAKPGGPHEVEVRANVVLRDAKRGKDVALRIYHPRGGGPHPVVIFSHGFGGNKDVFAYLSTFLASHGYVCIHPTHGDAGILKENAKKGDPLLAGLADPKCWVERVGDVTFVIDSLDDLPAKVPALKGKIDSRCVGVAGHSFGAYTAMLIGGVTIDLDGKKDQSLADPRVRAILPISPQGTGEMGLTERSWQALKVPMMTVTGSQDRKPGKEPAWRQEPFEQSPKGEKYELLIDGANHFSYGGLIGQAYISDSVKAAGLAFWDAHLKESKEAQAFLHGDGLLNLDPGKVTVRRK